MADESSDNPQVPRRHRSFLVNGALLRELRRLRGWTQEIAAERSKLSDRSVRKAERGGPLDLQSIAMLAQIYSTPERQITLSDLVCEPLSSPHTGPRSPVVLDAIAKVRRWFEELWNQQRLEVIDELAAPDGMLHAEGTTIRGRAGLRSRAAAVFAAFSEIQMQIQDITVHNDVVICRWRATLTQTGPWLGRPPSGKRFVVSASTWIRVEEGLFTEGWDYWELQLGEALDHKP